MRRSTGAHLGTRRGAARAERPLVVRASCGYFFLPWPLLDAVVVVAPSSEAACFLPTSDLATSLTAAPWPGFGAVCAVSETCLPWFSLRTCSTGSSSTGSSSTTGSVTGSVTGSSTGSVTGSVTGSSGGSVAGSSTGSVTGSSTGSVTGSSTGSVTGSSTGSVTGSVTGSSTGVSAGGSSPTMSVTSAKAHPVPMVSTPATVPAASLVRIVLNCMCSPFRRPRCPGDACVPTGRWLCAPGFPRGCLFVGPGSFRPDSAGYGGPFTQWPDRATCQWLEGPRGTVAAVRAPTVDHALRQVVAGLPVGGEGRPGQVGMAEAVAAAIEVGRHLVVQAGTGTGKSLAYLVPAILSGRKVVVATATKALQDQLAGKDLPLLARTLGVPVEFAVLKGRSNYLCVQRVREVAGGGEEQLELDESVGELGREIARIIEWAASTPTADRAELSFEPRPRAWASVSVSAMDCPGASRCPSG